jgi:hypothetical protein
MNRVQLLKIIEALKSKGMMVEQDSGTYADQMDMYILKDSNGREIGRFDLDKKRGLQDAEHIVRAACELYHVAIPMEYVHFTPRSRIITPEQLQALITVLQTQGMQVERDYGTRAHQADVYIFKNSHGKEIGRFNLDAGESGLQDAASVVKDACEIYEITLPLSASTRRMSR